MANQLLSPPQLRLPSRNRDRRVFSNSWAFLAGVVGVDRAYRV